MKTLFILLILVTVVSHATQVQFIQNSDPPGIIVEQTAMPESGSFVSSLIAPSSDSGYSFAYWTFNSVEVRDEWQHALNPVEFVILENTTLTAHYLLISADGNTNSVPDWWELRVWGHLTNGIDDADDDGLLLVDEYFRDTLPGYADDFNGGGISACYRPSVPIIADTNLVSISIGSEPPGLVADEWVVTNKGTMVDVADVFASGGSYGFCYWTVNGAVCIDESGRAVSMFTLNVESNTTATALFIPKTQDADGDGIPDWYEWNFHGTANYGPAVDLDGDGLSLGQEYFRDTHANLADDFNGGGTSATYRPEVFVIADTNLASVSIGSEPLGLVADQWVVTNKGATFEVADAFEAGGSYGFCYWTVNGDVCIDESGRAVSMFTLTVESNTTATALFMPKTQDADGDGVPDWYEWNFNGKTNYMPAADLDGDGLSLGQEYFRDTHANLADEFNGGGISASYRPYVFVIADTNLASVSIGSEPPGLVADQWVVTNKGATVEVSDAFEAGGSYGFCYWTVNGVVPTDEVGRAVSMFTLTVESNTTATALFIPKTQDADGDGVQDWYELNYHGTINYGPVVDLDGDGLSLGQEYFRDTHANLADEFNGGGISATYFPAISVDFQFFLRIKEVLAQGKIQPFFSVDTSVTGLFSTVANSHPALGDWDGDGDLDLFVGGSNPSTGSGQVRIFENAGSPVIMNWVERTSEFVSLAGCWTNVLNPAPSLGDWNHDGLADLAVGGGTGTVWLVASPGSWEGSHLTVELQTEFVVAPSGAIPAFADINADGWVDLLVLTDAGLVQCYTNTHSVSMPYAGPPYTTDLLGTPVPDARGIAAADVNGDGVIDVLISDENGNVWEFHGSGL